MTTLTVRKQRARKLSALINETLNLYKISLKDLATELKVDASRLSHWKVGRWSPKDTETYDRIHSELGYLIANVDKITLPKSAPKQHRLDLKPPKTSSLDVQVGGTHYKDNPIQPIEFIEANQLGFLEGCVVKRVTRHNKSTGKGVQDIDKAIHELQLLKELRYPNA